MAMKWYCAALAACWLGATAQAQSLPGTLPPPPGAGEPPVAAPTSEPTARPTPLNTVPRPLPAAQVTPGTPASPPVPAAPPAAALPPGARVPLDRANMVPASPVPFGYGMPAPGGWPMLPPAGPPADGPPAPVAAAEPHWINFSGRYLLWYLKKQGTQPPLVSTGSFGDTIPAAIGQPNTRILNQSETSDTKHNGLQFSLVLGEDTYTTDWSAEVNFFWLQQISRGQEFASSGAAGSQVIGRPFFNVPANQEDTDPIALPNLMGGGVRIDTPRSLFGGEALARYHYVRDDTQRVMFTTGFRFLSLEESLSVSASSTDLPGLGVAGNAFQLNERWQTRNRFYGAQFGTDYEFHLGPFSLNLIGKVGVGAMVQGLRNSARTTMFEPNGIVTTDTNNALLISPNNGGNFSRTTLGFVPEGSARFGFWLNEHIQLHVGYSVLYMNSVARPNDQVDRRVNVQPVGGGLFNPVAVEPTIRSSSFHAQGLDAGLRLSF